MTREQMLARVRELDAKIAAYPHWGAALTAMDEERRGLIQALERQEDVADISQ
jgi:hypothetical protein